MRGRLPDAMKDVHELEQLGVPFDADARNEAVAHQAIEGSLDTVERNGEAYGQVFTHEGESCGHGICGERERDEHEDIRRGQAQERSRHLSAAEGQWVVHGRECEE